MHSRKKGKHVYKLEQPDHRLACDPELISTMEECIVKRPRALTDFVKFPISKWLRWGGALVIFLGVVTFAISSITTHPINGVASLFDNLTGLMTTIMRGVFYYALGIIIDLLAGEKNHAH